MPSWAKRMGLSEMVNAEMSEVGQHCWKKRNVTSKKEHALGDVNAEEIVDVESSNLQKRRRAEVTISNPLNFLHWPLLLLHYSQQRALQQPQQMLFFHFEILLDDHYYQKKYLCYPSKLHI